MSQTEDYRPEANFPECSRESMVFSTVLYLVREKNIKQVSNTLLQDFKTNSDQHIHNESVWPWHPGRESYHQRKTSTGIPGKNTFHLYF